MNTQQFFLPSSCALSTRIGFWCVFELHLLTSGMTFAQEKSAAILPIDTPVTVVTPTGQSIELAGMRPQVLALSPDGKSLITSGKTNKLVVINPDTNEVSQTIDFPSKDQTAEPEVASPNILKPDGTALVSYTGLIYSNDGKRVYMSNVGGSIKVFSVDADGKHSPSHSIPLPDAVVGGGGRRPDARRFAPVAAAHSGQRCDADRARARERQCGRHGFHYGAHVS